MQEENKKYLLPLAIVVAGFLVAGAIYFGNEKPTTDNPQPTAKDNITEIEIVPLNESDHVLGNRNAPIVIIEYSDLECPFCKVFHETMKTIVKEYNGQVAWVYRHSPIPQLHSKAIKESEATECATELGGNDAFWSYTNRLYAITNSNNSLDPAELPKIANYVGLDVVKFNTCLSSGRYTDFINKSMADAEKAGAVGTPYSVITPKQPLSSTQIKSVEKIITTYLNRFGPDAITILSDNGSVVLGGALPIEVIKEVVDALIKN